MNGQFLSNRPVHVSYAYKKDTKGEKHGSETERMFAAKLQAKSITRPHLHFAANAANSATTTTATATQATTTTASAVPNVLPTMAAQQYTPATAQALQQA